MCPFGIRYKGWLGVFLYALTFVEWESLFCSITYNLFMLLTPFKQIGRFYLM